MNKSLTDRERSFLQLILRSPNIGDGWRHVSSTLWPLVIDFTRPELIEIDAKESGGLIRLSERGLILADYF